MPADRVLSGYLDHHVAAARSVARLVEDLAATEEWAARIVPELREELAILEMLRARVGGHPSRSTRVVGGVATTGAQVALRLGELVRPGLEELLALETIQLGIERKRRLWLLCLEAGDDSRFAGLDSSRLVKQAERQACDVDRARGRAAVAALDLRGPTTGGAA